MATREPARSPSRLRKWLRRLGVAFLGLVLLWVVRIGCLYREDPTYVRHLLTYPYRRPITTAQWYRPQERVTGRASASLLMASLQKRAFLHKEFARALTYAKKKSSTAFLVLHRGALVAEHYWGGQSAGSRTNSMSMAKTLVALLVGKAIQEGKISSEGSFAATYLPQWRHDARRRIKIKHLLQMHSGLRGDGRRWRANSDIAQLYFAGDILTHLWKIPALHPPGADFLYKDVDSQVLGALLEKATTQRFASYLSTRLWQPIGASDAFVWLDHPGGMARTSCCVLATARDWARVGQLMLQGGKWAGKQVIPTSWIKKMRTPSPTEPSYGYQLWLGAEEGIRQSDQSEPFQAPNLFYLDGMFRQRVYVMPSHQLVVVRLGERARRWDDSLLPNVVLQGILAWEERKQSQPRRIPARHRLSAPGEAATTR